MKPIETTVYDRVTGEYRKEAQYGGNALSFLYGNALGRLLLNAFISRRFFSHLAAIPDRTRFSRRKITSFAARFDIRIEEDYKSFYDFFIRKCERKFDFAADALNSPADAKLSYHALDADLKLEIKGCQYSADELFGRRGAAFELGEDAFCGARNTCRDTIPGTALGAFAGGTCLVFRLTVDDYHHLAHIDDGEIEARTELHGRLHTVRPPASHVKVFAKNHRIAYLWHTTRFGRVAALDVGALLIGRIAETGGSPFKRGEERGYFAPGGSTTILFFEAGKIEIDADIRTASAKQIETRVRQGERIGRLVCRASIDSAITQEHDFGASGSKAVFCEKETT